MSDNPNDREPDFFDRLITDPYAFQETPSPDNDEERAAAEAELAELQAIAQKVMAGVAGDDATAVQPGVYRYRPAEVRAMQLTQDTVSEVAQWITTLGFSVGIGRCCKRHPVSLVITDLRHEPITMSQGEWLIYEPNSTGLHLINNAEFGVTFEPVGDTPAPTSTFTDSDVDKEG